MWKCHCRKRDGGSGYAFYTSSVGSYQEFINRVIALGNFYRGRLSFNEVKNLPAGEFKLYWKAAIDAQNSKEGQEQKQAEILEDEMTDGGII